MTTGTVKFYNQAKGFGFIAVDIGGQDLYFAKANFNMSSPTPILKEGTRVQFEMTQGPKGAQATNIQF